jgi:DNA-binding response OmpR family regulator
MREVVARIRALLRRVARARELAAARQPVLTLGTLVIDASTRRVESEGVEVHLTPLEFDLLLALADRPGAVRGRDDLLREVWGWAEPGRTRTLDSHVKALRSKIGPDRVRTVHGVGYALEV